ncbi:hypothetical protein A1Q1_08168 [Trichosporon asahii var. asahii CBS 2479]|uniref:Uncharacterized protein n=1 Tax=Trichosporon asahii var. asahii (strain ATCC 90039 / CBS 2479 / JCM 2466 / KCTC 7840 / NBRC 103889/ NCYC 2677 / UAMH 7654) TaxID=1186058 RepID=J5TF41_TRIAS|nr:hypothetical protein A1Q1_08168 [Trichosporon asahii var. asahii CBS 2479]EJT50616.1 hypothetical protein A1Q1_08168 [Trichosporon asahii var. asahii CBS 2479]
MVSGHSSVRAHLATEYALLLSLYQRSRAQHRHQLFLRRLEAVLRLTRLVIRQYAACSACSDPTSSSSTPGGASASGATTPGLKSGAMTPLAPLTSGDKDGMMEDGVDGEDGEEAEERLRDLVQRSLLLAADITAQMLALHHFVPLQTMLIASYGRLFAICVHLCPLLGLQLSEVLSGARSEDLVLLAKAGPRGGNLDAPREIREFDLGGRMGGGGDLGEVISREEMMAIVDTGMDTGEAPGSPGSPGSPSPTPRPTLAKPAVAGAKKRSEPEPELESGPEPRTEPSPKPVKPKKKKSDMDDIFASSSSASTSKKKKPNERDDIFSAPSAPSAPSKKKKKPAVDSPTPSSASTGKSASTEKKKSKTDSVDDIFTKAKKSKSADAPSPQPTKEKARKKDGVKLKKKKKDAMDDIFGF